MMTKQCSQVLPIDWDKDGVMGNKKGAHNRLFRWLSCKDPASRCRRCRFEPGSERSAAEGDGNPLQYLSWKIPWTEKPGGLQFIGSRSQTSTQESEKNQMSNRKEKRLFLHRWQTPYTLFHQQVPSPSLR